MLPPGGGRIIGALVAGAAATVAVVASPVVLPALGFTTAGIATGSIAAAVHSSIGVVQAGSLFAAFQSAGAVGGLSWGAVTTAAYAGAQVGAAFEG